MLLDTPTRSKVMGDGANLASLVEIHNLLLSLGPWALPFRIWAERLVQVVVCCGRNRNSRRSLLLLLWRLFRRRFICCGRRACLSNIK
jgi:hypothetical protein